MASLPTHLYYKCRATLLQCDEFDTDRRLSSVFIVQELYPFRDKLSAATSKTERVEFCIDFLMAQRTSDSPVLIFFLRFLSDRYHPRDSRHVELAEIAIDIETFLANQTETESPKLKKVTQVNPLQVNPLYEEPSGKPSTCNTDVKILFLAADPTNASRLRLGKELREIQEKLNLARLRDSFELKQQLSARPEDISQALLNMQPQIVHFSGHGTADGALSFENQAGEVHLIQPDALAALFAQFTSQINCVILNACYSETQANAISNHIDHVIGMNKAVGDEAATAFSVGFYQALGAGRTIEEAYKLGCVQIQLRNIPEHLTPVLMSKKQTHL